MAKNETIRNADSYLEEVKRIVGDTRFGSITLIVQDGRVIQIDKLEKIRL